MRILAIETSCDDTGIAILEYTAKTTPKILANLVSSQTKIHAPWGGVVPMLAKREHQKNLVPLIKQALKKVSPASHSDPPDGGEKSLANASAVARIRPLRRSYSEASGRSFGLRPQDDKTLKNILEREPELLKNIIPFLKQYQKPNIDYIAVTVGPGLEPALWTGVNFARALAYFWNLPIISINHVEAHISANWLKPAVADAKRLSTSAVRFPAICLVVSGGHTQLILIKKIGLYEILGETRDDAAGEAFDKVAKMLNLGYPGGPAISKIANSHESKHEFSQITIREISGKLVKISDIKLPRPMLNSDNFDFSFSGLKTAVLYLLQKIDKTQIKKLTPAIAAEFQQAVIDVLTAKTLAAAQKYGAKTIMLAGGVAANDSLRDSLALGAKRLALSFSAPPKNYCTDNAAMIALAAYFKQHTQRPISKTNWQNLSAQANLRIA